MNVDPQAVPAQIGICSWSLQVKSISELKQFLEKMGNCPVQIACGDPHHADWIEGESFPELILQSGIVLKSAMLGFPGEDYTTPQSIQKTGGFGDTATRSERLDRLDWGLERTKRLGLSVLTLHAGFIPRPGDPNRNSFLQTLAIVGERAAKAQVIVAFETGQEPANLLRLTLDELSSSHLKVNFDPANMLLYDQGNPIEAVEILGKDIVSVHLKDAKRPLVPGTWGEEVPLGHGEVNIPRFLEVLKKQQFLGPFFIEREVGNQLQRFQDIVNALEFAKNQIKLLYPQS